MLAPPEAVRAVTAIHLLLPQVPMLFMGEEWDAPEPFVYFCDFKGALAKAIREGRRRRLRVGTAEELVLTVNLSRQTVRIDPEPLGNLLWRENAGTEGTLAPWAVSWFPQSFSVIGPRGTPLASIPWPTAALPQPTDASPERRCLIQPGLPFIGPTSADRWKRGSRRSRP